MDRENLFIVGAEYSEIKFNGFWDWFINFSDINIYLKYEPTYVLAQFAFLLGGIITFAHAITRGGRLPHLWFGTLLHGIVVECMCYILPDIDNFWHSQTFIMFVGRRLPLHIIFLYPCFIYNSSIAVAKMELPKWAEPFAVGLGSVLIDIPYDIISVNYLHWTWHDTDPNIEDRHYWVPWNSYYFHISFACSFTFWFHMWRRILTKSKGKWIADESIGKEILCTVLAGIMGTPGGILLFLPVYHPLHDIFKIHSEVTFFIVFSLFLLILWTADRNRKPTICTTEAKLFPSTWLLIVHLLWHYGTFLFIPIFFNAEDEIAIGLKEPIGPCNEYTPVNTAFGMVLKKRKYLCPYDYDEKYFDWKCLPDGKPPSNGSYWYTACGVSLPNKVEYIAIVGIICTIAFTVFGNLHFLSSGDEVFNVQNKMTLKTKKEKITKKYN